MIPNMKLYVVSIIAIFAALGIGIYIGFTLDANNFVAEQKEDIATKLEKQFDLLRAENESTRKDLEEMSRKNDEYKQLIGSTYEEIIQNRLEGQRVAIIETRNDYIYSGIKQILEIAGADTINLVIINDSILDEKALNTFYKSLQVSMPTNEIIPSTISCLTEFLIAGKNIDIVEKLLEDNYIDIVGTLDREIDYIIIAGGGLKEDKDRIALIDEVIITTARDMNMPSIGVEKLDVNHSYIPYYKNLKIPTVDNVDTVMGRISLVLAIEGRPGHYGVKSTAEDLFPDPKIPILERFGEK
ncbi:MAG: copper transporter [Tissierellia bacterium]|nr:copper transporter [Tissierellia bacterium]